MHAIIDILAGASDGAGELGAEGEGRAANVIRVERVGQRGVGNVVVDAVVDEVALASRTLLDGSGGAGREGRDERGAREGWGEE